MQPTRWYTVLGLAAASTLVCYLVLATLEARANVVVPVPALSGAGLLLLAAVMVDQGRHVRRLVAGRPSNLTPLQAARVAVLAKASALGGGGIAGYFAAQLVLTFDTLQSPGSRTQAWASGGALLACVVLVVVGLLVESWCRLPPDDDEDAESFVGETS